MQYRYSVRTGVQKLKTKSTHISRGLGLSLFGLAMAIAMPLGAHAASPNTQDLLGNGNNWRVFNAMPDTAKFWDINQAKSNGSGGVQFPFQQFVSTTTGSFAVYLENNYNNDLTDKTISADVNWTPGKYTNRGTGPTLDAYVRLEFQDVASGNYTSNDYWWNTGSLNLNAVSSGTLTGSLSDRSQWTNVCGQAATDTTPHPGSNCVGGTDPAVSPYDGFTNAMKNVKQVNLSFGRASRFASGVAAVDTDNATFDLTRFTVRFTVQ